MNESKTSFKLKGVESVKVSEQSNVADLIFEGGVQGRITFLEENIFRYDVDPAGEFAAYATPRDEAHTAKIQQRPDESSEYTKPEVQVLWKDDTFSVLCGETSVTWDKHTGRMSVYVHGRPVMEEMKTLIIEDGSMKAHGWTAALRHQTHFIIQQTDMV